MSGQATVEFILRFIHVSAGFVLLGTIFALRFLVVPRSSNSEGSENPLGAYSEPLTKIVFGSSLLILMTGLLNYMFNLGRPPIFHAILGIKILLALHIFLTSFLTVRALRSAGMGKLRRRLNLLVGSGLLVLFLATWLHQIVKA